MSTLLYLQASPRGERSHSIAVADAFVEAYGKAHPDDEVVTRNLFEVNLPPFDGFALEAKYAILHGQRHSPQQAAAWKAVEALIAEFKSADKYLLAVPMWNFGIPYRLKHYIDILVQPTYTFSFSPGEGFKGLVTGKPALIVYARGGEYGEAANFDFQKRYLDLIFGFMGFTGVHSIVCEPTLMGGPDVAARRQAAAVENARALAKDF